MAISFQFGAKNEMGTVRRWIKWFEIFQFIHGLHSFANITCKTKRRKTLPQLLGNKFFDYINNRKRHGIGCSCALHTCNHLKISNNFFCCCIRIVKFVNLNLILLWPYQMGCNFSGFIIDFWLVFKCSSRSSLMWLVVGVTGVRLLQIYGLFTCYSSLSDLIQKV